MFNPRGAAVVRMRLSEVVVGEDGTERKKSIAAGGVVVVVRPDSRSRKKFREFCQRHGLIAHAAERAGGADGTYNRRTGEVVGCHPAESPADYRQDPAVTAWQVMGDGEALSALVGMDEFGRRSDPKPFVESWHFALSVRVPVVAGGSGEERPRPPMGSAFGKPSQVKATAAQLADDRSKRVAAALKSGNI